MGTFLNGFFTVQVLSTFIFGILSGGILLYVGFELNDFAKKRDSKRKLADEISKIMFSMSDELNFKNNSFNMAKLLTLTDKINHYDQGVGNEFFAMVQYWSMWWGVKNKQGIVLDQHGKRITSVETFKEVFQDYWFRHVEALNLAIRKWRR